MEHTKPSVFNDKGLNLITKVSEKNIANNNENVLTTPSGSESESKKESIFVCTFCQVFSTSEIAIANHIAENHSDSLIEGTSPKNYVSKLKSLTSGADQNKNKVKKVGRPKKDNSESSNFEHDLNKNKKTSPVPSKSSDGLYWCKKCHRHFQKPRQYSVHVCVPIENQNEVIEDFENESDGDKSADFKIGMNVQPTPWSRIKLKKLENMKPSQALKSNEGETLDMMEDSFQKELVKTVPNWREDSSYIHLFNSENEKQDFEKHLKSIDYNCVNGLYEKVEMRDRRKKDKKSSCFKYACIVCRKIFNNLSQIRMHCLTHTDLKPFTCPKCSYRSNAKASLYTHMRIHTGNVFHCSQCSFQTTKRSHLLDHEQTHSTILQRCELCKNMYKNLKSLTIHVKKYHTSASGKKYIKSLSSKQCNKNVIECDICGKNFTSIANFKSHNKYYHSMKNKIDNTIPPNDSTISEKDPEKLMENLIFFGGNSLSDNVPLSLQPYVLLTKANIPEKNSANSFNGSISDDYDNSLCDSASIVNFAEPFDIQNKPENSFVETNLADFPKQPILLDCSVMLEPLDHQLISYHRYDYKCDTCDQPFSSESFLESHKLFNHSSSNTGNQLKSQEVCEKITETTLNDVDFTNPSVLSSLSECRVRIEPLDDQLVELMLNDLLQQKSTQNVELFDNVYQASQSSVILNSNAILDESLSPSAYPKKLLPVDQFQISGSSILDQCEDKLDILDECLRQSNITNEDINGTTYPTSNTNLSKNQPPSSPYDLQLTFPNNQLKLKSMTENIRNDIPLDSEQKSEEIKLFEKCRKAPAYVCCVCSGIFICTSTLKAHLKEHVSENSNQVPFVEYPVNDFKSEDLTKNHSTLNNVCGILEGSNKSDKENELEKLYTSSLHKMWYLPEVSVVLENDQSLIDAVLDDIPNFPINDKFDEPVNLHLGSALFSED